MSEHTDTQRLTDGELLPLMVASEHRNRQRRRGHTILFTSYPACPMCQGEVIDQLIDTPVDDFDTRVLTNMPCGHRMSYTLEAAARLVDQATDIVDREENQPVEQTASNATADALAAEIHRRAVRLEELRPYKSSACLGCPAVQVDGEVIGLRGALGIVLGGTVPEGTADELGLAYYRGWLSRHKEAGR